MAGVFFVLVLLGSLAIWVWLGIDHRRRRDLNLSRQWAEMWSRQHTEPAAGIAQVSTVYQRARRGSKAVIRWLSTDYQQDTWFEGSWPRAGSFVLLRGSTGWGPHNQNPHVFYVNPDQLLSLLPRDTMAAVQRQQRREARHAGR